MIVHERHLLTTFKLYALATGRDAQYILNRATRNVLIRTYMMTPVVPPSQIRDELESNPEMVARILSSRGRFAGLNRAQREQVTRRFINARVRSSGYIRIGWSPAMREFGLRIQRPNPRSHAARGFGHRAGGARYTWRTYIGNASRGSTVAGDTALRRALRSVSIDMRTFARRRLIQTARRFFR